MITAFSRESNKKVYVQHRLKERAKEVNELLQQKAYFYVCGDAANMAREVNAVLARIIAEGRGVSEQKGEEVVKHMRSANQYQVRTLCIPNPPTFRRRLTWRVTGGCLVIDDKEHDRERETENPKYAFTTSIFFLRG
ncbi:hypothetical protein DCS_00390 [Drechmeria coniospora]|uniref:NADPH--hemoprotein reductase n=1 Tax=Drechmeria coniospora TaxID=98403 RepID=A0A151GQ94_DRECN|nr:hypothetical protein DCS_00390 [Drechmeria coniospora]KYK59260.1 hypothetical protein DCS_00390 [Drechmeria coniospora]